MDMPHLAVQHIREKHFWMIRYFWSLANRLCCLKLLRVHEKLGMNLRRKASKLYLAPIRMGF
ncbi:hypothetical protein ALP55_200064 [Pseudomonas coronafaciens pv. oryzae]|nr:hypothetical protein ALP55_200064 [Pseudomonas coronafaciens pv. oryzae]